jgi:ribonuclease Z
MKTYVQVVGSPASGVSPAVLLFLEKHRILFNVPEGFQRVAFESKVRLGKLRHVMLTRIAAGTLAGLPGLFLTLADSGLKELYVRGPSGLDQALHAARPFMNRPETKIVSKVPKDQEICFEDESLTVRAIEILQSRKHIKRVAARDPWGFCDFAPVFKHVLAYHGHVKTIRGKFDKNKAMALGLKPGPLYGKLSAGESVQNPSGTWIHPQDVLGSSTPAIVRKSLLIFIERLGIPHC